MLDSPFLFIFNPKNYFDSEEALLVEVEVEDESVVEEVDFSVLGSDSDPFDEFRLFCPEDDRLSVE